MTCTPYGVNTHRLLVSATRSAIPDEIPAENDAVKDARAIGAITCIATLVVGALLVWLRRKPWLFAGMLLGGRSVADSVTFA